MKRSIKFLVVAVVMTAMLAVLAGPALVINDKFVPADECSGNPTAVGEPAATTGLAQPQNPINPPVSLSQPGQALGAQAPVPSVCQTT